MPSTALTAVIALGACGFLLLGLGLAAMIGGGSLLAAFGGVLGVAELVVVGRVVERRQAARVAAMSLALVQAGVGVGFIATGHIVGLVLIALAGLIVLPLSTESAEQFFAAPR
jgi:hypothetical protein